MEKQIPQEFISVSERSDEKAENTINAALTGVQAKATELVGDDDGRIAEAQAAAERCKEKIIEKTAGEIAEAGCEVGGDIDIELAKILGLPKINQYVLSVLDNNDLPLNIASQTYDIDASIAANDALHALAS